MAVAAALDGADPLAEARKSAATEQLRARLDRALALRDRNHDPTPGAVADALGNSSAGHESVPAALYAATQGQDFEQAVSFAVACGGDADTIGAMTGAVAGARFGAEAIPVRWLKALEDGERGRTHVERLAERLHCSWSRS